MCINNGDIHDVVCLNQGESLLFQVGLGKKVMIVFAIGLLQVGVANGDDSIVVKRSWLERCVEAQNGLRETSARSKPSVPKNELGAGVDRPVVGGALVGYNF